MGLNTTTFARQSWPRAKRLEKRTRTLQSKDNSRSSEQAKSKDAEGLNQRRWNVWRTAERISSPLPI
jgi:hypothetical protein